MLLTGTKMLLYEGVYANKEVAINRIHTHMSVNRFDANCLPYFGLSVTGLNALPRVPRHETEIHTTAASIYYCDLLKVSLF